MLREDDMTQQQPEETESKRPVCEECDKEMYPFAADVNGRMVEGWGCDYCGWSFDDEGE